MKVLLPTQSAKIANSPARFCVVITPSPDSAVWYDAVGRAIADAEMSADVFLTSDINQALNHNADHWAIILPEFDPGGSVAVDNDRTRDISRALAAASDAAGHVVIVDRKSLEVGSVEILPDIRLSAGQDAPMAESLSKLPSALEFYRTGSAKEGSSVRWALDLMHTDQLLAQEEDGSLRFDMTGKARMLVWGPHITLSAGSWRAELEFEVDARGAKNMLVIDWGPLSSFSRLECRPGRAGIHRAILEHTWGQAEVAEMRVALAHGAFSGSLQIRSLHVTVRRPETASRVEFDDG